MNRIQIGIDTPEGRCPAEFLTPGGGGPWPGVIFYMDGFGLRPATTTMAARLAAAGFAVLLPDLFYRLGPLEPLDAGAVFAGDVLSVIGPRMASTDPARGADDTRAFLNALAERAEVLPGKVGAVGFCMGGGIAIASAAAYPDRFGAVASFHGGNLATDAPSSPHLRLPALTAELYVAAAREDASYPPAMAERFEAALRTAGVPHRIDTVDAAHGWMNEDFPVYDAAAAAKGWAELIALFRRTLPGD